MSKQSPGNPLELLPWMFAAGAVFWLIVLTWSAANLAAPAGREQLHQWIVDQGVTRGVDAVLVTYATIAVAFMVSAAILHGAAYYGLRAFRAWGWAIALFVAAAWSLILVGIPMLLFLLRRPVRQAYGIS